MNMYMRVQDDRNDFTTKTITNTMSILISKSIRLYYIMVTIVDRFISGSHENQNRIY